MIQKVEKWLSNFSLEHCWVCVVSVSHSVEDWATTPGFHWQWTPVTDLQICVCVDTLSHIIHDVHTFILLYCGFRAPGHSGRTQPVSYSTCGQRCVWTDAQCYSEKSGAPGEDPLRALTHAERTVFFIPGNLKWQNPPNSKVTMSVVMKTIHGPEKASKWNLSWEVSVRLSDLQLLILMFSKLFCWCLYIFILSVSFGLIIFMFRCIYSFCKKLQ